MNDIRVMGSVIYFFLLFLFLFIAKAAVISTAWVWWPMGIIGAVWALFCFIWSNSGGIL